MFFALDKDGRRWSVSRIVSSIIIFQIPLLLQLDAETITRCPNLCRCVKSKEATLDDAIVFKYVACSGPKVNDISHLNLPQNILWLDMSNASLQSIPSYFFYDHGLVQLTQLDLKRNNISIIYVDSFIGLEKLKYLDLSYNKIKYFDSHSLVYNELLSHLILRGTDIPIPKSPLIVSPSLKLLDISDCEITGLHTLTVSELPSLVVLNISRNPIFYLKVEALEHLHLLRELDITKTDIKCDRWFSLLSEWGKTMSIKITGFPCLNSHQDSPVFRSKPRTTMRVPTSNDWETPEFHNVPVTEGAETTKPEGYLTTEIGILTSPETNKDFQDVSPTIWDEEEHPSVHWTIWLATGSGFAFGVALTFGLGAAIYWLCCRRRPEEPNEVVSAGEEFQLVEMHPNEVPVVRDDPPPYSSLFEHRRHPKPY